MTDWYYAKDYQQYGPIPEEGLLRLIASGTVLPEDLVWTESMADWAPARDVFNLSQPGPVAAGRSDIEEAVFRERPTVEHPARPSWEQGPATAPATLEPLSREEGAAPDRTAGAGVGVNPMAVASLILSILGMFWCSCFLMAIPGVICGYLALKQIDREPDRYTGRGIAKAGIVVGCIAFALQLLIWIWASWSIVIPEMRGN